MNGGMSLQVILKNVSTLKECPLPWGQLYFKPGVGVLKYIRKKRRLASGSLSSSR
jgi:hypothetical protein